MSLKGKLIVGAWGVLSACVAVAMPTKAEFQKVLPLVREISADDVAAVKSGKMTPLEAGNNAFARAKDTSIDEASRYLFHESAFAHYVRAAEYDKAAEVVESLKTSVKDVPDSAIAEFIERRLKKIPRKHAGQLYAMLRDARVRDRISKKLETYRKAAAAKSADADLQTRVAAANVLLENWEEALKAFAKCGGETAKVAVAETGAKAMAPDAIADFWWTYKVMDTEFTDYAETLEEAFKSHAAMWYRQALDSGALKGVKRQLVEKRIEGIEPTKSVTVAKKTDEETPSDKSASSEKTVPCSEPKFADGRQKKLEFELKRGVKLEFLEAPAGSFMMGKEGVTDRRSAEFHHKVTITRPFFMSKTMVSQEQFLALMTPTRPWRAENEYDQVFGNQVAAVCLLSDIDEYCAKLTKRYRSRFPKGYVVRLPTEAEYEYTVRKWAGETSYNPSLQQYLEAFKSKGIDLNGKDVKWFDGNLQMKKDGKTIKVFGPVGLARGNAWGFLDFKGANMVLDRLGRARFNNLSRDTWDFKRTCRPSEFNDPGFGYQDIEVDPLRYESTDLVYTMFADMCVKPVWMDGFGANFRLVIGPDLIAEKGLKKK